MYLANAESVPTDINCDKADPSEPFKDFGPSIGISMPTDIEEHVTGNGIYICATDAVLRSRLERLTCKYYKCWEETGTILMDKSDYMLILLVEG